MISIVGICESGIDSLEPSARKRVRGANVLVGSKRHLQLVPKRIGQTHLLWRANFSQVLPLLRKPKPGERIVILSTGDPLWFGIAERLIKTLGPKAIEIFPNVNAFSLAAARLSWGLSDPMVRTISIHSQPFSAINKEIISGHRLLILSKDGDSPKQIATLLMERGFGESKIAVLEHMGGNKERRVNGTASDNWKKYSFSNLNILAVDCKASTQAVQWSLNPGLPEKAYIHDGKITKRVIRAVTISALEPMPGHVLWDVGSGSGSIAIEWLRSCSSVKAVAIERDKKQLSRIKLNSETLGTPHLKIVEGQAPKIFLKIKENPQKIFIGGGISSPKIINECIERLLPTGLIIANSVTIESKQKLLRLWKKYGGDLTTLATSSANSIGRYNAFRPAMEVMQWRWQKN